MLDIILPASSAQVLVNLSRMTPAVYSVRVQIRAERSDEPVLLAQFPLLARVAENVMSLNAILPGIHAVIHVVREDAP